PDRVESTRVADWLGHRVRRWAESFSLVSPRVSSDRQAAGLRFRRASDLIRVLSKLQREPRPRVHTDEPNQALPTARAQLDHLTGRAQFAAQFFVFVNGRERINAPAARLGLRGSPHQCAQSIEFENLESLIVHGKHPVYHSTATDFSV